VYAMLSEAQHPEIERLCGHCEGYGIDRAATVAPTIRQSEWKEGDERARLSGLIAIVEVIRTRIIEVDRLLDEPEAENARVEVDVGLRIDGNGRDVVNTGNGLLPVHSQAELRETRMVIGAAAQRPGIFPIRLFDRQIIDARDAACHETVRVELPVFI